MTIPLTPDPLVVQTFDPAEFAREAQAAVDLLVAHLTDAMAGDGRVFPERPIERSLDAFPLPPVEGGAAVTDVIARVLAGSIRLHHPRYLGHQVAVPAPLAAIGELVSGLLNNGMAVYEMGQAATAIERRMLEWMFGHVGFAPDRAGGIFTSGGSAGNLTALLAARQVMAGFDVWREGAHGGPPLAILGAETAHYCNARSAQIMGLGRDGFVPVPVDALGRLVPEALPEALRRAERSGRKVVAVIGSACSTPTGCYDPLEAIADFCAAHRLWFHVDGAHGAAAAISPRYRKLVAGIERADSVVWDAHKMLLVPALATGVLFRDGRHGASAFVQDASYLFPDGQAPWWEVGTRTLECTKRMLSLPLYLLLSVYGEALLVRHVEASYDAARRLAAILREAGGFEVVEPQANIVCFRVLPGGAAAPASDEARDALQVRVRERILASGSFYVVKTRFAGKTWLRVTIMHPLTTDDDLRALAEAASAQASIG